MGRDFLALLDNGVGGFAHDDAGEPHRSSGMRAATLFDDVGIVFKYAYVVERHAEPLRYALRKRRLVALSTRKRADHDINPAAGHHLDIGAFARIAAGGFEVAAEPDASQSLAFARLNASPLDAFPV